MPAVEEEEEDLIEIAPMSSLGAETDSPLFVIKKLEQPEIAADFQITDEDNATKTVPADEGPGPKAGGVNPPQSFPLSNVSNSNSSNESKVAATPTTDEPNSPRAQPTDVRPSPSQSYTLSQRTSPVASLANPAVIKKKSSSFIVRGIKSKLGKKK